MITIRDKKQRYFADKYINSPEGLFGRRGILNLCARFGKIRTSVLIFKDLGNPKILIAYPEVNIKKSWEKDFKELKYKGNCTFTTFKSLHKYENDQWDILVLDEIHLLSTLQLKTVSKFNCSILGLTGTLSEKTRMEIYNAIKIPVIATYSLDEAIKDGVITDYQITIKLVDLDNKIVNTYKGSKRTEKAQFDAYSYMIRKLKDKGVDTFFLRLARMRIIQNSIAKINATKKILEENKNERILVFGGNIKTTESMGCTTHHSKKKNSKAFDKFVQGSGNHMAVVKIGNTGTTYKPLDKVIVNYFDSNSENLTQKVNRCMALEYDNKDKKANIWIISSTEDVELSWLKSALEFFDPAKIKYENL